MSENGQHAETLSPEQRKAVEALAAGATKEMAAVAAGRTRRTLDRWLLEEPAFAQALRAATNEAVQDAARRLSGLLELVISAVASDIESGETSPRDNLRALDIVAKHAVKLRELEELEQRITALEERL
jgi:hypothetical protein